MLPRDLLVVREPARVRRVAAHDELVGDLDLGTRGVAVGDAKAEHWRNDCSPGGRDQLGAGRKPRLRVLRERALDDLVEPRGQGLAALARARRRLLEVAVEDLLVRRAGERRCADEALEEDAAERVDVDAAVERPPEDLLRRRVLRRADEVAGDGERARVGALPLAQPEVRDERAAVARADQDVPGLHVAVEDPACVRRVERARDLREDLERAARLQPVLRRQERAQVGAVDVLEREVEQPVGLAAAVDPGHVRVVDGRRVARLADEALAHARVAGELRPEDLERDRPARRRLGEVHRRHPALREEGGDAVLADAGARRERPAAHRGRGVTPPRPRRRRRPARARARSSCRRATARSRAPARAAHRAPRRAGRAPR